MGASPSVVGKSSPFDLNDDPDDIKIHLRMRSITAGNQQLI